MLKTDRLLTWVKAIMSLIGAAGIAIKPQWATEIVAGFGAMYGIIQGVRAELFKK